MLIIHGSQGVIQDLLIIQVEPSLFCLKVTCLEKSYLNFQSGLCSYLYSITVFSPMWALSLQQSCDYWCNYLFTLWPYCFIGFMRVGNSFVLFCAVSQCLSLYLTYNRWSINIEATIEDPIFYTNK